MVNSHIMQLRVLLNGTLVRVFKITPLSKPQFKNAPWNGTKMKMCAFDEDRSGFLRGTMCGAVQQATVLSRECRRTICGHNDFKIVGVKKVWAAR